MSLRYSINVTLDGCVDHRSIDPSQDIHEHARQSIARADALLFGRVTYELMQAWRTPSLFPEWMQPFAHTIGAAKKYVVSSTLQSVDWNTELIPFEAIADLEGDIALGGVALPRALAQADLIDEYEFVVQPRIAGHGPTLLAGVPLELTLVDQTQFPSGATAMRYVRTRR